MSEQQADWQRRFGGIARLYGEPALERFANAHVCVIGVGGVGSWAVEALARSGIGALTLIDLDNVAESNTNRQLPALDPYYGMAKVSVLAERVRAINPHCKVTEIEDFVEPENLEQMLDGNFDYIVDCIDALKVKTLIAAWCVKRRQRLIVSGGAGGQMDPARIGLADLAEVREDPLLSKLRYNLRRHHGFARDGAKMGVRCVYSTEPITQPQAGTACETGQSPQGLSCAGFGASMVVTASFGLFMVGELLKVLARPAGKRR